MFKKVIQNPAPAIFLWIHAKVSSFSSMLFLLSNMEIQL